MAKQYRVRPLLSQSYYIAIGRAIATWAALEIKIDEQILRMLNHEKTIPIRTRNGIHKLENIPKGLKIRLDLFDELAQSHYSGQPLRQFLNISKQCRTLSKDRHRLAHGEWYIEHLPRKPPKLVSRMRRAGAPGKSCIFTVNQIRQLTHKICDVHADLNNLMVEYHPDGPLSKRLRGLIRSLPSSANL